MVIIFRKTSSKIILTGKGKEKKDKEKEGKEILVSLSETNAHSNYGQAFLGRSP